MRRPHMVPVRLLGSVVLLLLGSLWAWQAARVEATNRLERWAPRMHDMLGNVTSDGVRTLQVNGATVHVDSGHSTRPLQVLLNGFAAACPTARQLAAGLRLAALADVDLAVGLRGRAAAVLACVDLGETGVELGELVGRIERAATRGELGALGTFRVLWASADSGGSDYLMLESAGAWALRRMFPERGDAPGRDPSGVPRPTGSRRILSAAQLDGEPGLSVYEVPRAASEAAAGLRAGLRRSGWQPHDLADASGLDAFWARRGDRVLSVVVERVAADRCTVTLAELGGTRPDPTQPGTGRDRASRGATWQATGATSAR